MWWSIQHSLQLLQSIHTACQEIDAYRAVTYFQKQHLTVLRLSITHNIGQQTLKIFRQLTDRGHFISSASSKFNPTETPGPVPIPQHPKDSSKHDFSTPKSHTKL